MRCLSDAALSVPDEFPSDFAVYHIRRPYVDCPRRSPLSDLWAEHSILSPESYRFSADATRGDTIEIMAEIRADGSVAVLHGGSSFRHIGGSTEAVETDINDAETLDGSIGCVVYIDEDGNEREYWLGEFFDLFVRFSASSVAECHVHFKCFPSLKI